MSDKDKLIRGLAGSRRVYIGEDELTPRESEKVICHSPDGFNWGYGGSGPAQLALAILLKFVSTWDATRLYQQFKWDIIAKFPQVEDFAISVDHVQDWINKNR